MSDSGWFPDPGGARGRFRYWDGEAWSETLTDDPSRPSPGVSPGRERGGNKAWLMALAVLALITIIVAVVVLRGTGNPSRGGVTEDTNSASPTGSPWDEVEPTPTPTPTPTPPPTPSGIFVACPVAVSSGVTPQTSGRQTADTLSVKSLDGWIPDYSEELYFAYDLHAQSRESPFSTALDDINVGLLAKSDGFTDITTAAAMVKQCWVTQRHGDAVEQRDIIAGESLTVSGHPAWHIRIYIKDADPLAGDCNIDIYVVDLGADKDHLGFFGAGYSARNPDVVAQIADVVASMAVSG